MENKLAQLAVVDRFIHVRILGLSKWLEPARKQEICAWPSLVVFRRELVLNRMSTLEVRGLVKTTTNYCLPKDEVVGSEAASLLMPAVLVELERMDSANE